MPKILLVDDETYVTATLAAKLGRGGHSIVRSDGQEGLNLAKSFLPDLIVSDLQMPIMTGMEMAMELHKIPETRVIPIILLTGRGHLIPQSERDQSSVKDVLQKPFSIRDMVERIEQQFKAAA